MIKIMMRIISDKRNKASKILKIVKRRDIFCFPHLNIFVSLLMNVPLKTNHVSFRLLEQSKDFKLLRICMYTQTFSTIRNMKDKGANYFPSFNNLRQIYNNPKQSFIYYELDFQKQICLSIKQIL